MPKTRCRKDTGRFWEERTKARKALDRQRADAPYHIKIEITEKLRQDAILLKSGKVAAKP